MIELIPAIDIIDGKCVRLSQGDYNTRKVYNENPVEVAKEFEAHGIHRFFTATLPKVTICAPLSKAMTKSSSVFIPPPKSMIREVRLAICENHSGS